MTDSTKYLGKINCTMPTCGQPVPLFESKKGLAHFTCNECGCQVFTRNNRADRILRERVIKPSEPAAPAKLTPVKTVSTAPAAKPAPTPARSSTDGKPQQPAAAAAPAKRGGLFFGRG